MDCVAPSATAATNARITQIKTHAWDNTSVVIVGNKADLKQHRAVDKEDGKRLADELGIQRRRRARAGVSHNYPLPFLPLCLLPTQEPGCVQPTPTKHALWCRSYFNSSFLIHTVC